MFTSWSSCRSRSSAVASWSIPIPSRCYCALERQAKRSQSHLRLGLRSAKSRLRSAKSRLRLRPFARRPEEASPAPAPEPLAMRISPRAVRIRDQIRLQYKRIHQYHQHSALHSWAPRSDWEKQQQIQRKIQISKQWLSAYCGSIRWNVAGRVAHGGRRRGHNADCRKRRVALRVPVAVALACPALHTVPWRVVRHRELRIRSHQTRYEILSP